MTLCLTPDLSDVSLPFIQVAEAPSGAKESCITIYLTKLSPKPIRVMIKHTVTQEKLFY